uniref:Ubiquitin-like protease family profile domain-containing protein n=1 Tax=Oryza glumipatula TaxID=40148 RepID=A0A0E0AXA1_9ORYZ
MTHDGFEQPDLIRWLMDRTDPKTMTIQISENKKIAITPWKISIVLGTPFGGEPLQYPDKKCMAAAFAQLANELGVPPSSNISVPMLKSKLEHRKDDPTAVRFFIMILTNKLLLPSTSFYITKKDAWLGMDLSRVARIDWSKAVFDLLRDSLVLWHKTDSHQSSQTYICSSVASLVLLYIDNLDVIKLGLTIDRLHTPRIQLYTKDLVEAISQGDRVKDEEDKIVFGQLNFNGILASCYSHPDYDKDKEPRGDNAGTPFADELVTAVHINFPSMFDTIGPHIYGLHAEQNKRVLDALGEYDRQAKICADNIAKNIRRVQTCHARVSDHIVSIIRGAMQTQETAQRAGTYTEKQPTFQGEPAAMPSNQEDVPKLADTAPQSRTPPSTAVMECLVNTIVIPDSTMIFTLATMGFSKLIHLICRHLSLITQCCNLSAKQPYQSLKLSAPVDVSTMLGVSDLQRPIHLFPHTLLVPSSYQLSVPLKSACYPKNTRKIQPQSYVLQKWVYKRTPHLKNVQKNPEEVTGTTSHLSKDGGDDLASLSLPSDDNLSESQLASKIDQICLRECDPGLFSLGNEVANNVCTKKPTPFRRPQRRTKMPASAILIQADLCFATCTDIVKSFSARQMAQGMFIDAFADFLSREDMENRPLSANNRIFIPTTISALINIENVTRNDTKDNYKPDALVEQLHFALGNIEMFLPVIHDDHWSLYIINHNQKSFDILDSKRYDMIGGTETQHHFPMAQKTLKRLSDGFQVFMGGKFPKFGNYRKCYIKCPKMAMGSNDCAFYVMRFMEKYNGDADKLLQSFPKVPSDKLRAQILHHLIFNRFNSVQELHQDIETFRVPDNAQ